MASQASARLRGARLLTAGPTLRARIARRKEPVFRFFASSGLARLLAFAQDNLLVVMA